jgi:hypothetical protein
MYKVKCTKCKKLLSSSKPAERLGAHPASYCGSRSRGEAADTCNCTTHLQVVHGAATLLPLAFVVHKETTLHSPHTAQSCEKEEYKECTGDFGGKTTWEIFRIKRKMRYENYIKKDLRM